MIVLGVFEVSSFFGLNAPNWRASKDISILSLFVFPAFRERSLAAQFLRSACEFSFKLVEAHIPFVHAPRAYSRTYILAGDYGKRSALGIQEGAIFEGKSSMIADTMELKDISRYLDIEEDKILEWASAGKIPAIQDGERWVFERKRIEHWVKETK